MCGFTCCFSTTEIPFPVRQLSEVTKLLSHRGPDGFGFLSDKKYFLGHTRLAIIDLNEQANQPMLCSENRYAIVYNGEVYNYKILKSELEKGGCTFETKSDTEVLLQAWIKWGDKCLNRLDGMFAFCIYDKLEHQVILARDCFGKKPLYYSILNGLLIISSELRSFVPLIPDKLNSSITGLTQYLSVGYTIAPTTIYQEIQQLLPGHYSVVKPQEEKFKINHFEYWNYADFFLHPKTNYKRSSVHSDINNLVVDAVKKRTVADVNIGVLLSGGLDSGAIASVLSMQKSKLQSYSIGFTEKNYDETIAINKTAQVLGLESYIHQMEQISLQDLTKVIEEMDGLLADNSYLALHSLCGKVSDKLKVVLSGDGADEIFAGYSTYMADKIRFLGKYIPFRKMISKRLRNSNDGIGWKTKVSRFMNGVSSSYRRAHYSWREIFNLEEIVHILGIEHREEILNNDPFNIFNNYYEKVGGKDIINQHLYVDAMTWLSNDILVKVDRASMQHGVEVRCPFLDKELVEYMAAIPGKEKFKWNNSKNLLRVAMKENIPTTVLKAKKKGFNVPIGEWLQNGQRMNEFQAYTRWVFDKKLKRTS